MSTNEQAVASFSDKETRKVDMTKALEAFTMKLAEETDKAALSDQLKGFLRSTAQFYNYSWGNQMLIVSQCPHASRVAGYKSWVKFNRAVNKSEKAIWILAPLIGKKTDKKTGEDVASCYGFRTVPVFDISQTSLLPGCDDPLKLNYRNSSADAAELLVKLEAFVAGKGWDLEYVSAARLGQAKGCTDGAKILVLETLTPSEKAGTIAHECAHALLHFEKPGKLMEGSHTGTFRETEAESVSYVVLQAHGIEQNSELYVASWGGTAQLVKESLQRIVGAAREILNSTLDATVEEATE